MGQLTAATAAPDQITYMDTAAATAVGLKYKQRFVAALNVRPGQTAIDIGCGPGNDLGRLADAVGIDGSVIGVDRESRMLDEAHRRLADRANIELHRADIHDLPLRDGVIDRARVDRVLQHVLEPVKAMAEVRRVLRSGGLFGMAEPDWDTVTVADEDVETCRRFANFLASQPTKACRVGKGCASAKDTNRATPGLCAKRPANHHRALTEQAPDCSGWARHRSSHTTTSID